jgi:hypothetical protein
MKITLRELRQIVKTVIKEEKKSIKQENVINAVNAKLQGIAAGLGARLRTDKNNAQIQKYATQVLTRYSNVSTALNSGLIEVTKFKQAISALQTNGAPEYKAQIDTLLATSDEYLNAIQTIRAAGMKFYSLVAGMQRSANSQGLANKQAATAQTTTPAAGTTQAK